MLYAGPTWMLCDTRTATAFRVNFDVIVSIFIPIHVFGVSLFGLIFPLAPARYWWTTQYCIDHNILVECFRIIHDWSEFALFPRHLWPMNVLMSFYHVHSPHLVLCTEKERQYRKKNFTTTRNVSEHLYTIKAKHEIKYRHNDRK